MRHLEGRVVVPVLLALLVGCGSTTSGEDGDGTSSSGDASASATPTAPPGVATQVGECGPDDEALQQATQVARADLDGDGRPDPVAVTAPDATGCPATLFARVADGFLSVPAPAGQPGVTSGFGVRLPGAESDLLVTEQRHPRGGTQTRVYAAADGALAELQDPDGNALVPFVATDTPPAPVSVTCTDEGIAVTEAVTHQPAGVVFTWDVRRTSYAVSGGRAERTGREEIADNVLPGQLRKRFPELARAEVLADCRT